MPRYTMNQAILAKIESTPGTDSTPTGAANAILISNLNANPLNAQNVDRNLLRIYMGGSGQLVGTAFVELSFDVEFQNGGTAGTAPPWGPLVRACGFAEAASVGSRVEYTPVSTGFESCTIYYHDDGVLHKALMARGTFDIDLGIGNRPVFKFKFVALDGGVTATANPSETLTAWKPPLVVTDSFTGDFTIGATYTTGTLSGGSAYPSRGLSLSMGVDAKFVPLLGTDSVDITGRSVSGHVDLDLTAAQEVAMIGTTVKGNGTQAISLVHGTAAGYKMMVHAPAGQFINPSKVDYNGRRLVGLDLRVIPSTGNDELRLVAL